MLNKSVPQLVVLTLYEMVFCYHNCLFFILGLANSMFFREVYVTYSALVLDHGIEQAGSIILGQIEYPTLPRLRR